MTEHPVTPAQQPHNNANHRPGWRIYVGEFWKGDLGLTLVTLSLVVEIFIVTPMREAGLDGRIFFNLLVMALMVSAAAVSTKNFAWKACLMAAVLVCGLLLAVGRMHPSVTTHLWGSALVTLTLLLYVGVVLDVMFRSGPITWSRIQGGVCAYLLIGMAFASGFQFLQQRRPAAFQFATPPADIDQLTAKMTYYSFSILTTVGSDITTTDPYARSLTTAEAIIGQLFPTILIGALVAMAIQGRTKGANES